MSFLSVFFFVLLLYFVLRRAAAFVLSPIHFIYNFEYHIQSKKLKNKINKFSSDTNPPFAFHGAQISRVFYREGQKATYAAYKRLF